jgi:hypothetical protein
MIGAMGRRCAWPIVVVLLGAAVAGCAGAGAPTATPGAVSPQALAAGTYQSQAFQPRVEFTLPAGWWIASDAADYLALQPVDKDQVGIYLFRDPKAASQDLDCPLEPEPDVGTPSSELSAWMRALPGLITSNPRLASVGGLRGTELDLRIADGWQASCPFAGGLPTVPLFVGQDGGLRWVVAGSERLRLSLLDVSGGGTVVVDIDAFDGSRMDGLLNAANPIVGSMAFSAP